MAHWHSNQIDQKLNRLRDIRRSALPLRSDADAIRLLLSTQDAFHALVMVRDKDEEHDSAQVLQS